MKENHPKKKWRSSSGIGAMKIHFNWSGSESQTIGSIRMPLSLTLYHSQSTTCGLTNGTSVIIFASLMMMMMMMMIVGVAAATWPSTVIMTMTQGTMRQLIQLISLIISKVLFLSMTVDPFIDNTNDSNINDANASEVANTTMTFDILNYLAIHYGFVCPLLQYPQLVNDAAWDHCIKALGCVAGSMNSFA
jgi:hypothetical protein